MPGPIRPGYAHHSWLLATEPSANEWMRTVNSGSVGGVPALSTCGLLKLVVEPGTTGTHTPERKLLYGESWKSSTQTVLALTPHTCRVTLRPLAAGAPVPWHRPVWRPKGGDQRARRGRAGG